MEKKKQELETRPDDRGFDEENPELGYATSCIPRRRGGGLEQQALWLIVRNRSFNTDTTSTGGTVAEHRANVNNLDTVIKEAEAEIEKKVSLFEREKSILASQEAEVKILDRMAEVPVSVLAPGFVPTATEAGVERSSAISRATTRVRAHVLAPNVIDSERWTDHPSCRSTIRSSLTDDREEDVSIFDVNVPLTRSKKGKRLSSKGNDRNESTRKVRTSSYISEAEMCSGIGSPGPNTKIFVKPLRECRTPEAKTNTGFPSSSNWQQRKYLLRK
ncbi:hypothetical protein R1sor_027250 [Riccia sorocarpa]|uniref:Uncharacterized protein n=1 Tax=Riccia sorocarpa TaxID=122646 RepID=A0ABD3GGJ7_9MARC